MNEVTTAAEIKEVAVRGGFEIWLGSDAVKGWYTCILTGKKMRGEAAGEQLRIQKEYLDELEAEAENEAAIASGEAQMTPELRQYIQNRGGHIKLVSIACVDCGEPRDIKPQDAFQVKRCVVCQKNHQKKRRTERRREQRIKAREAVQ